MSYEELVKKRDAAEAVLHLRYKYLQDFNASDKKVISIDVIRRTVEIEKYLAKLEKEIAKRAFGKGA